MIELAKEQLILLRDVPRHLPHRPGGKRLHVSAVYRWVTKGVGGVVLESVRLGGASYTSVEALQRFATAQSTARASAAPAVMPARPRLRHQRVVASMVELELGLRSGGGTPLFRI